MGSLYDLHKVPANRHLFDRWLPIRLPAPIVERYYYSHYVPNRITGVFTLEIQNPVIKYISSLTPLPTRRL